MYSFNKKIRENSRSVPGVGSGNPLQYSCLKNSVDRGAWQAAAHGVTKSWTWLSDWAAPKKCGFMSFYPAWPLMSVTCSPWPMEDFSPRLGSDVLRQATLCRSHLLSLWHPHRALVALPKLPSHLPCSSPASDFRTTWIDKEGRSEKRRRKRTVYPVLLDLLYKGLWFCFPNFSERFYKMIQRSLAITLLPRLWEFLRIVFFHHFPRPRVWISVVLLFSHSVMKFSVDRGY